jgi:hypothetical protein
MTKMKLNGHGQSRRRRSHSPSVEKELTLRPIAKWTKHLDKSRTTPKPLVFAIMANDDDERFVQVVHGFGQMMLEDDSHQCDGTCLGFFLGDRTVEWWTFKKGKPSSRTWNLSHFATSKSFATYCSGATGISLSDGAIKRMGIRHEFCQRLHPR